MCSKRLVRSRGCIWATFSMSPCRGRWEGGAEHWAGMAGGERQVVGGEQQCSSSAAMSAVSAASPAASPGQPVAGTPAAPTWKTRKLRALTRMLYCSRRRLYCSHPTDRSFSLYCRGLGGEGEGAFMHVKSRAGDGRCTAQQAGSTALVLHSAPPVARRRPAADCCPRLAAASLPCFTSLTAANKLCQAYGTSHGSWPCTRTSEVKASAPAPVGLMVRSKCSSSPSGASNTSFTPPLRGL